MSDVDKEENFEALLNEYDQNASMPSVRDLPSVGDKVRGRVVSVGQEAVFIELGAKAEAMLDIEQVTDEDGQVKVAVGDELEARVVDIRSGQVILRTSMGRGPDARAELAQAHTHGIPVDGQVTAVIKGGVEVQVAGVRAFCPISQLDNRFVEEAAEFVGQKLQFRIIRYEQGRGQNVNIVLSRRVLLEEEAARRAEEIRAQLHVGAVLPGKVVTIKGYGAFVDIGGVEGMLHISELGFNRVDHPSDVLSEGQALDVQIIKIEKTDNPKRPEKISLSIKALARDPWNEARDRYRDGTRSKGTIVRIQPYGAFVELEPGVEGLVHISEMVSGRRISHPKEVVRQGQEVEVIVLSVDGDRRRISLSMAETSRRDEADDAASYRPKQSQGLGTFADLLKKKR